jgi:hypothetical protein
MSDASIPPVPPVKFAPPAPPVENNAQVISLPGGLRSVQDVLSLHGQITKINADGTAQIATEQGDINVRPDARQILRAGERVDVELQPGNPPQSARITPEQTPSPRPQQTNTPQPDAPAPSRTTQTPVSVDVRPPAPQTTQGQAANNTQAPLPTSYTAEPSAAPPPTPQAPVQGQVVRLEPLPLPQALAAITQPLENIVTTLNQIPAEIITQLQKPVLSQNILQKNLSLFFQPQTGEAPTIQFTPQGTVLPEGIKFTPPQPSSQSQPQSLNIQAANKLPTIASPATPQLTIPLEAATAPPTTISAPHIFNAAIQGFETPSINFLNPETQTPLQISLPVQGNNEPLILYNLKAGVLFGIVAGQTPDNLPIIGVLTPNSTPQAPQEITFFTLHAPSAPLPTGTEIILLPHEIPAHPLTAQTLTPSAFPYFLTPDSWPVMDEIYQTLSQIMPQAAQAFANITPSPANPGTMEHTALFFMAAIQGGDLTQWMNDRAVDALRRSGRAGLITRLSAEGSVLNKLSSEVLSQDWRGMSLPLFWEGNVYKLPFYYKHSTYEGEDGQPGGKQVRFVFDLSLNQMGKVQLDGLFRGKRLDLIVRTEQPLSSSMQMQMRKSYVNALELTQVSGELSFQNKPDQWVTITAEGETFGTSA